MEMSAFAWDLLDGSTVLSLGAVLFVKLLVLKSIPTTSRRRSPAWMAFFGCFAMAYVTLFAVADHFDPLEKIAYKRTLGRLGIIRGYLGPWIAEFYYLNDERLMQRAPGAARNQKRSTDPHRNSATARASAGNHPGGKSRSKRDRLSRRRRKRAGSNAVPQPAA